MKNTALLLTQYEKYGIIGKDEYIENYINEELDVDAYMIDDYNEYLIANCYEPFENDLEMMLYGREPLEIARMTFYGDFRFAEDYHRFNGYGNIDSFSEGQVVNRMKENRDFLKWYIEENDLIDFEDPEVIEVIEAANKLLKMGY